MRAICVELVCDPIVFEIRDAGQTATKDVVLHVYGLEDASKLRVRRPNLFTGFDPEDNLRLHELRANRPFPVVNSALNLVAGKDLAWQQRKAESFTASPLHCGAARLGYRRSQAYGGEHAGSPRPRRAAAMRAAPTAAVLPAASKPEPVVPPVS